MAQHDFSALYALYPGIIDTMESTFTSHQFILKLAQAHQQLYVEALYAYRNNLHRRQPVPFMMVHKELARGLSQSNLVEYVREVDSKDIFGESNRCGQWRKV